MIWRVLKAWAVQVMLAVDQLLNTLIPPLDGTVGHADETLSARSYRAHRDRKFFGRLTMPLIDLLFVWQGPRHCYRAYLKEYDRANYPDEYRTRPRPTESPDA